MTDPVNQLIDGLREERDRLAHALFEIKGWCDAYPIKIFTPLTDEQVNLAYLVLQQSGIDIGALHAGWARHLLQGISRIANTALGEEN